MKIRYLIILLAVISRVSLSQVPAGNWTVNPDPFFETQEITITVSNLNSGNLSGIEDIYLWTWYSKSGGGSTNDDSQWNGQWNNSNEAMKMSKKSDGSYNFTFTPSEFFNDSSIETIGVLAKAKDGSGDKKTQDHIFEVGVFDLIILNPQKSISIIEKGGSLEVEATTSIPVNFLLRSGDNILDQLSNSTNYSYTIKDINDDSSYKLSSIDIESSSEISKEFHVVMKPDVSTESIPYSNLKDGLNYLDNSVFFILNAPGKQFVNLLGSFNNWEVSDEYLMRYDDNVDRFWIEVSGLDTKSYHSYQYLVDGSIYIADPYSTIILDSYHDSYICKTSECGFTTFPSYPKNNKHAASMFKVDDEFEWDDENFKRPEKENLVIYELLVRDFHEDKSFQSVISKLDYLEELGINAIELMPVNEFDGNSSWGYNPSFHMAIDKEYGSPRKLKELVNEAHKRGIAIILDVVYNHATGQNPYFRLWNSDHDNYSGVPTSDNPFFQISPVSESYLNYFNDMNHESVYVRDYMKRINKYLIDEFHIDGFRFDLTKGMTNEVVAENYSSKRVNYLKGIADDIWDTYGETYIIFEHFQNSEERIFSDYGIMTWGEENYQYNEATMGYPSDFNGISYKSRGFSNPTLVGFMESHDKERLMYKNITYGNSTTEYDIKNFNNSLARMKAAAALFLTVPGPKMIWQFGELGYEKSINTCEDGTVRSDCKLSPKPSAFKLDMDQDTERKKLYGVWSRILKLRKIEKIFNTNIFNMNFSSDIKFMTLEDEDPGNGISQVIIVANFGLDQQEISQSIVPNGSWYNIYANNQLTLVDNDTKISLSPGQFIILADKKSEIEDDEKLLLSSEKKFIDNKVKIYPIPFIDKLFIDVDKDTVSPSVIYLFNSSGKLVSYNLWDQSKNYIDYSSLSSGIYNILLSFKDYTIKKKISKK
tara:strand:- start:319 stop:3117 length:2799 start_codon:yes stop_codon:yes gene_type:complete